MSKKIQRVEIDKMNTKLLELGYQDENIHTQVQIDCSSVLWDYPDATAEISVQPPSGDKYPVMPELVDNVVYWDVTNSDLVYPGSGKIQVTLKNGEEVIKSASCATRIMESITTTGPAPTPLENWMERAEETAHQIALTAKDEVIEQIQDAAEEARESIPADYTQLSDDVTGLKSAFEQLDANVITESAGPAPIVSIADGADGMPMRKVEVAIEPVQDLHGYDSPWPAGGGKNLLDPDKLTQGTTQYVWGYKGTGFLFKANTTYTFSIDPSITYSSISIYGVDESTQLAYAGGNAGGKVSYTPTEDTYGVLRLYSGDGIALSNIVGNAMLEIGSDRTAYSPYSNVCPISGWTGAKVTRTGKNLAGTKITNRIPSGSPPTAAVVNMTGVIVYEAYIKQGGNYTITAYGGNRFGVYVSDKSISEFASQEMISLPYAHNRAGSEVTKYSYTLNNVSDNKYIGVYVSNESGGDSVAIIEKGSAESAHEPYQGQTYEVTFPTEAGTVYGGTLTVNEDGTGKLVVDRGFVDTQSNTWTLNAINDHGIANFKYYKSPYEFDYTADIITNLLPYDSMSQANVTKPGYLISGGSTLYVRLYSSEASTVAEFKQWASANGLQILLKLATPVTYQLTNQQVIETLKGVNNIWCDSGKTAITYPADTKMYIDRKITEAVANALNA